MENRIETPISEDFLLIANPISGKGNGKIIAEKALERLTSSGRSGRITLTTRRGDARRLAQEAIRNGCRWLIACGGDGTVHEVVNAIAARSEVLLGLIPCGRGNDFARALGIPKKTDRAIQVLLSGRPYQVDVGRIGDFYFDTIVTCGYDAEVSRRASESNVPFSGTATYVYAAIATLFSYNTPAARIEGDFGVYEGDILLAATGITPRYGGGFKIVPDAVINDGLFDVCIIEPVSRLTVLSMLVKLFWGGHTSHPAVSIQRTKSLTIHTEPPTLLYADGEQVGYTPATVQLVERGLTVLVPSA
ncbi:MAG: diacylglycerol kinase family lipid kinase [Candidatus Poribacteria bacterium]|nr:diacylglycerol kinase family lipid kinase [Candidatus Poribacteria bacterium]MDE0504072.1 diacylglycerol kinase family lipid kinase [Candidatus Poribacteria bacterium]